MFFFFNDTATTEIYTLSLHDALPISRQIGGDAKQHEIDAGEDLRSEPQREDGQNLEDHRRERRGDEPSRPRQIPAGERSTGRAGGPPLPGGGGSRAPSSAVSSARGGDNLD